MHFKPNKAASVHGGHAFYGDGSGSGRRRRSRTGSKEDLRMKSLKTSGSAVMLSELEMEGSYHGFPSPFASPSSPACACAFTSVHGLPARSQHPPSQVVAAFAKHLAHVQLASMTTYCSSMSTVVKHYCSSILVKQGLGVASEMRRFQVSKGAAAITLVAFLAGACMAVSRWRCCLALAPAA